MTEKRNRSAPARDWLDKIQQTVKGDKLTDVTSCIVIPLLAACLGEACNQLIAIYEETTNTHEIENSTEVLTPHVAVVGDLFVEGTQYFLLLEKRVVTENLGNLADAFIMAFAAHYVFNMEYNSQLSSTWEFIQRYLAQLNPSRGSKGRGKKVVSRAANWLDSSTLSRNMNGVFLSN